MRAFLKKMKNQQGQVLLLVIVALTIALAIGLSVSLRTLASISRSTRSDTASRVLATAEGGAERFLLLNAAQLQAAVGGTTCPAGTTKGVTGTNTGKCLVSYAPITGDSINSQAAVTVSSFSYTNKLNNGYEFNIAKDAVKEVSLSGLSNPGKNYQIRVCWLPTGTNGGDIYLVAYDSSNVQLREGVMSDIRPPLPYDVGNFKTASDGSSCTGDINYDYSYVITLTSTSPYGLRIRALVDDLKVGVFPVNIGAGNLPAQGYKITSTGVVGNISGTVSTTPTAVKTVNVYKSFPYAPNIFDFSIYSEGSF